MAVATTTLLAAGGLALAGGQAVKGVLDEKKYNKELDNLRAPETKNSFEDIPISTLGSDITRERGDIRTANLIEASRSGGSRTVLSAIPQISALDTEVDQNIRRDIDGQIIDRNFAIAEDNTRIRSIEESRYQGEVAGLGNAIATSRQDIWNGLRGVLATSGELAEELDDGSDSGERRLARQARRAARKAARN